MGLPRIEYNSKRVEFDQYFNTCEPHPSRKRFDNEASSGIIESINFFDRWFLEANIDKLNQMFVSSSLLLPLINQMTDDPFKTPLFHGGFGEEVVSKQLNQEMSDRIAASTRLPVVEALGERLKQWLRTQPRHRVETLARRRFEAVG